MYSVGATIVKDTKFWWDYHRPDQSPILVESLEPSYAVVAIFPFEKKDLDHAIAQAESLVSDLEAGRADPRALSRGVPEKYRWSKPRRGKN